MAIPKYSELYNNVLSLFSDETEEYKTKYVKQIVSDLLNLTPEERNLMVESGREPLIENRVGWTITYLKQAGLLESKQKGYVNITELGLKEIKSNPNITNDYLMKFPSYVEFKKRSNKYNKSKKKNNQVTLNFVDEISSLISNNHVKLCHKISLNIRKTDLKVFKKLILDLLLKLDLNKFNFINEGVNEFNGLINQDKLGLDKIAIHAINTSEEVKVSDLQLFAGLIVSKGLSKGIFITTSSFNSNVSEYIKSQSNLNIALIDGKKLVKYMIEYNIGVSTTHIYEIKELDGNYFK